MIPTITSPRFSLRKSALLALGCAFCAAFVSVPALKAADAVTLQSLADAAPALPLSHSFTKVEGGEKGPYVLKLKNESSTDVTVTVKILLAVVFHAETKARNLPAHKIEAGKDWSIADLAAEDKVTVTAEGYAPLEIVVK
jgi:hypothetical protein